MVKRSKPYPSQGITPNAHASTQTDRFFALSMPLISKGHIMWAVEDDGTTVSHLSHFGSSRLGDGAGSLDQDGNLSLTIRFSDEPAGTYRHYVYSWKSADEYHMVSRQYDAQGNATGNWYAGSFVRIKNE
jgi:hypothetical protein